MLDHSIIETEETLVIETPERVPLHFALASIGNRFLACAIDHFIQTLVLLIFYFLTIYIVNFFSSGLSAEDGYLNFYKQASNWVIALAILVIFTFFLGYFAVFEWIWNGQTPGKYWLKLRVIREDGRPITFFEAVARNILRVLDMFPGFFYSVGLISVFLNGRDQRVGDFFAGTVVVRERTEEAPTFDEVFASPVSDSALRRLRQKTEFTGDFSLVGENEIEVVESFLRRREDLSDRQREWMAWRVAMPIMYKLKPAYDLQTFTYEGFLEELVHKFHERHRFVN